MIYELLTNCKSTRHRPAAQAHRVCCDVKGHSHQWPDAAQVEAGSLTVTQYDLQTVCAKKKKNKKKLAHPISLPRHGPRSHRRYRPARSPSKPGPKGCRAGTRAQMETRSHLLETVTSDGTSVVHIPPYVVRMKIKNSG